MTNYEKLKNMTLDNLADYLCDFIDAKVADCDACPVNEYCRKGCNGFKEWLREEANEDA